MEERATASSTKSEDERPLDPANTEPVLLALHQGKSTETTHDGTARGNKYLEQLQIIETGSGPKVDTALLLELLKQSPEMETCFNDPTEVHNYHNPLASVNEYKHRLHAIRCEYVAMRMRLEGELNRMRSSRVWRLANGLRQIGEFVSKGIRFFQSDKYNQKRAG